MGTAGAASDVCFIAVNEQLLELDTPVYSHNGVNYVPYTVFSNFHIYCSFYAPGSVASLYTSSKQLYFNLSDNTTRDNEDNYYASTAIMRNGQIYVPATFVCDEFGLQVNYIYGNDSGDVLRIKDSSAVLSDKQFLSAASSLMTSRYNAYVNNTTAEVLPEPDNPQPEEKDGCDIYLSFQGLPSSTLLDMLSRSEVTSCFFLSESDIRSDPDTIRRIVGEGHSIGILCSSAPYEEYVAASALLYEAVKVKTVLIASSDADYDAICQAEAGKYGLVYHSYDIDGVRGDLGVTYPSLITSFLQYYTESVDVRILCNASSDRCMGSILNFISTNNYNAFPPDEIH